MENKKLKKRIAMRLISNEMGFLGNEACFAGGTQLSHSSMLKGLTKFVLDMVAREESSDSKAELKKGVMVYLKKRKEE